MLQGLKKKDPVKAAGLKTGGRADLKIGGLGQQARDKKVSKELKNFQESEEKNKVNRS